MSEYGYQQYSTEPVSSLEEGRTFPTQDSPTKRILLASSDSTHRRMSSSALPSTAPTSMPSNELEEGALTGFRRSSTTPSTSTLPNAVSATGPPPSANESAATAPASISLVLPPPPEPVDSVYEPPTPLPARSSRRPLPALPDAPRFVPLHGLPPPPPPAALSRLNAGESEELTTAEEEKRAYARARGLDELFEPPSASTGEAVTGMRLMRPTETELPDYTAGGSVTLTRGRSMLKRDEQVATIAEDDEARANADEARQRINAESERLLELDAADSKATARRRMEEEAEEEDRQPRQQTPLNEHSQARKRRDDMETVEFDIDEIDGLDDPPPPHDAVPTLMPDDLLPLTDSKATWPVESASAASSSHPAPFVPTSSLLPPPPVPLAIASADTTTSFSRPSLHQAQTAPALATAPDFLLTNRPHVLRNATVATLPVTHQESLFYPGAVPPFPASLRYASPSSTGSADTTAQRRVVHRTTSVGPAAAFYTSDVGGAEPTVSPAFYAAVTPGGPLLPFYASPPSTSGGPVSYYTPASTTTLPLPSGTFESAAGPATLLSSLPFDHQRSLSAPQHVQQVMTRHASPVASRAMSVSPSIYDPATGSQVATRRRESSFGIWSRSPSVDAAQTLEANAWAAETASDYGSLDGQARGGGGAAKWRRLQTIRSLFGRQGPGSVLGDAAEEAGSTS